MSDTVPLPDGFFRDLNPTEELEFRDYARAHDPRDWDQWCLSHPVCRDEWTKLGKVPVQPENTPEELPNWCCSQWNCHTSNGPNDTHCVNCGRKRD